MFNRSLWPACAALLFFLALALPASAQNSETGVSELASRTTNDPWLATLAGTFAMGPSSTALLDGFMGIEYEVADNVRVGLTDISFASTPMLTGSRYGISLGPTAGYYHRFTPVFEASANIGLPIQTRWGASVSTKSGIAPYAQANLDFYIVPGFSLALLGRAQYIASDAYLSNGHMLPGQAGVFSIGLATRFHF